MPISMFRILDRDVWVQAPFDYGFVCSYSSSVHSKIGIHTSQLVEQSSIPF